MGIPNFDVAAKRIFWSNVLLIICCAFYLVWWMVAFKPVGGVRGMTTGWLLIPASTAGIAAIYLAVRGILSAAVRVTLLPSGLLVWGGVAAYILLLAVTRLLFKRPVTTELFLIVGWGVLALTEINVLYGTGLFSHGLAAVFVIVIAAAVLISLVCYVLYYNLGGRASYFDGMVPLLMVALVMAGVSVGMVV